ncbi:hypothetical protein M758_UG246700 [Ceratodon purpureus]|nr:hypothetical protein M758_UG246700 [Ceratodon purpureus]
MTSVGLGVPALPGTRLLCAYKSTIEMPIWVSVFFLSQHSAVSLSLRDVISCCFVTVFEGRVGFGPAALSGRIACGLHYRARIADADADAHDRRRLIGDR